MRNCADSLETGKLQYPTVAPLISFYNRVQRIIQTNRPYIYILTYPYPIVILDEIVIFDEFVILDETVILDDQTSQLRKNC